MRSLLAVACVVALAIGAWPANSSVTRTWPAEMHRHDPRPPHVFRGTLAVSQGKMASALVTPPTPDPAPDPGSGVDWDAIAACESGGNWSIDTGNGYYGGLQ